MTARSLLLLAVLGLACKRPLPEPMPWCADYCGSWGGVGHAAQTNGLVYCQCVKHGEMILAHVTPTTSPIPTVVVHVGGAGTSTKGAP